MSEFDLDIRNTPQRIREWVLVRVGAMRRVKPAPLLVRVTAAVAAFLALLFALPVSELGTGNLLRAAAMVFGPAVCVGVLPRTRWVTLVAVTVVLLWVFSSVGLGEPAGAGRVALLAGSLYVMHAAATLAAVVPADAVLAPGVIGRWAARTAGVTTLARAFGLGGLALAQGLPATRSSVGPIVGSVIAAALAGLLAWLLVRRR
jgi:uncharacterized protein (TIGR03382 family)